MKNRRMTNSRRANGLFVAFMVLGMASIAIAYAMTIPGQVHDPTEFELSMFLWLDKTNMNEFRQGHVCLHFARELKKNALNHGINMSLVLCDLSLVEGQTEWRIEGHALNGVRLANGTFLLVEPQTDQIIPYNHLEEHLRAFLGLKNLLIRKVVVEW